MTVPIQLELSNLAQKLKDFNSRLESVKADRGLTKVDKEHYGTALVKLESRLTKLHEGTNNIVHTTNKNVKACNNQFIKVARLFQLLAVHIHNDYGVAIVSSEDLLKAEVELTNKRLREIEEQPDIIHGQITAKGYRHLENVDLSAYFIGIVKSKERSIFVFLKIISGFFILFFILGKFLLLQ